MTFVVFSIDTERDSSHHIDGNPFEATTFGESKAAFSATEAGLKDLLSILEELEIPATFFFEAQTALKLKGKMDLRKNFKKHEIGFHGFHHEDFAGVKTGVKIPQEKRAKIIARGKKALEKTFARKIKGIRTPYLGWDSGMLEIASENFEYDSSFYGTKPITEKGLRRIPVFEGVDAKGKKMQGFLWPLMEGDRKAEDYLSLVKQGIKMKAGPIVIATHSWHTRMTRKDGRLDERQAREKIELVKKVLSEVKKLPNAEFTTLDKC